MAANSPTEILHRIIRLSGINGWCVTVAAGLGTLVSLALADVIAAFTGAVVTLGGITELRGRHALLRGDLRGIRLLFLAQLLVLLMILVYAITQLLTFDAAALVARLPSEVHTMLQDAAMDVASLKQLLTLAHTIAYSAVILASVIYQGGLAIYYRHRAPVIAMGLNQPPPSRAY